MFPSILVASALALGAWGANGCGPVGPSGSAASDYEWKQFASDPGRAYLYRGGVQVAAYDYASGVYRTYDAASDSWGEPQTPPWETAAERRVETEVRNFGVDTAKLSGHGEERYHINGRPASREQVRQALTADRIPDDAGRLRLTVIGEPAQTAAVAADISRAPALAEWKDRLTVQTYPPDHWAVARAGFVTSGRPTIYCQSPAGTVLHHQDDYADGAEGLARALRRADPNYDAKKDPDLRSQASRPRLNLSAVPTPAWLLAAGLVYLWLRRSARG